jgi:hypothetical protein
MCPAGGGGNVCADTTTSPVDCGQCGNNCNDNQACIGSACVCRPGLTLCNGQCRDLLHDIGNCGACGAVCGGNGGRCVDGVCQQLGGMGGCGSIGRTNCNNGCYTIAQLLSDELNCGQCGNNCAVDELCTQGQCRGFFTSKACTTCPCPACGTGTTCCQYPGTTEAICVNGNTCPM